MHRIRAVAATLMLAALGAGTVTAAGAGTAAGAATVPAVSTLTQIRAAHQPGYDRLVFQFSGVLPAHYSVRYVPQVIGDASGPAGQRGRQRQAAGPVHPGGRA